MISGKLKDLESYLVKSIYLDNDIVVKSKKESLISKAIDKAKQLGHIH